MAQSRGFVIQEEDCAVEGWADGRSGSVCWRTLISADRTPTDSLTVGVAELEPGETRAFRPHRHAQPEVYYVLSGRGVLRIGETDHDVRPGTAVFIPGSVPHGARNTGAERLRLLYVFPTASFAEVEYEFPDPPVDATGPS